MTLTACPECGTEVTAGLECPLCGTPTPAPAPDPEPPGPAVPDTVARHLSQWEAILEKVRRVTAPKYAVKRVIGYGGMAGVYLAEEPRLGRMVAVKVMSPALMVDPQLVERFGQEARTIAQFNHPNIVTIYEVDEREGLHYFTMTYVPGRTLGHVMTESTGPLPIDVVRAWLYQIGDALAYAHHQGVIHRDIKPGNVLLDLRGNALVTDFGIAKVADEPGLTRTGMLVGTPAYMSPEQCSSGKVTGASDQYSVGAVAYQMLTGQPPFAGPTLAVLQAHVGQEPQPIRELRPDCPDDLVAAVQRMLEKQPEDRWPGMSAAVAAAGASPPGLDGPVRERLVALAAPAAEVRVEPWSDVVREGATEQLEATVSDASGRPLEGRRVVWQSSDAFVASVHNGRLRAFTPGSTNIDVSCGAARTTLALRVESHPVRSVEVEPAVVSLPAGGRTQLDAVVADWDGTRIEKRTVLWSSSGSDTARVSRDGVVEGLRPGEVVITASTGGQSATARVTVGAESGVAQPHADTAPAVGATLAPGAVRDGEARSTPEPVAAAVATPAPAGLEPAEAEGAAVGPAGLDRDRGAGPIRGRLPLIAGGVVILAAITLAVWQPWRTDSQPTVSRQSPAPPAVQPVTPQQTPSMAAGSTASPLPETGDLEIAGTLPAGYTITLRRPDGTTERLEGRSLSLQPATYRLEFSAPDHEPDQASIVIRAGETERWTPNVVQVVPRPTPTPPPTQPVDSPTTVAAEGILQIGGTLPAGYAITLRQPDGTTRRLTGRSQSLPPGTYTLEFSAPDYEPDRTSMVIRAGETRNWTPNLREAPPARPVQPPVEQPAARDVRADQTAIEASVRAFVDAFQRRDVNAVVPLLPAGDFRNAWRDVLENRGVTDFQATLASIEPARVDGDTGSVRFSVQISFEQANATARPPTLNFVGSAERGDSGWRLVSLQQGSRRPDFQSDRLSGDSAAPGTTGAGTM